MVFGLGAAWILDGLQITIGYKATNDDPKDRLYGQLKSVLALRVGDHLLERMRATSPTSTAASVR